MIENLAALRARLSAQSAPFFSEYEDTDPRKLQSLSLEQQKKRAKELLRQWRNSTNYTERKLQLADAQRVIARQHGNNNWTDLKAHIERMVVSRQAIEQGQPSALDDDHRTSHIAHRTYAAATTSGMPW